MRVSVQCHSNGNFLLSRLSHTVTFIWQNQTQKIISIALQSGNLVIVLKFMIQRLLQKSSHKIQDTPARKESLELYTYFYPLFRSVNNKNVSRLVFANITGTFWVERRKDQCLRLDGIESCCVGVEGSSKSICVRRFSPSPLSLFRLHLSPFP